jgi:hypothetical protein
MATNKGVATLILLVPLLCAVLSSTANATVTSCANATFRTGPSAGLPDCRVYEQVSPVEKGGSDAVARGASAAASPDGEKLVYQGYGAFPGAAGNTASAEHLSVRSTGIWQTSELTPAAVRAVDITPYLVGYDFSEDLSQALLTVALPLTPEATPDVYDLFLRNPSGGYTWVNSKPPTIPVEDRCPPGFTAKCFLFGDLSAYAGAANGFTHVLFESNAQLGSEAPETGVEALYESSGGQVELVGILPDGQVAREGSTAGAGSSVEENAGSAVEVDKRVEHAISESGSRVVFEANSDEGESEEAGQGGKQEVYDRIEGKRTIELSAPAPGAAPKVTTAEAATFWAASGNGSRVFFTSSAELTTPSNTGEGNVGEDLYEYNLETGALTDLTVDTNPVDVSTGAMVQGVVGTSNDGSYVYFVANGQLVEGEGVDGQPNLYVVHGDAKPRFIATLNGSNACGFGTQSSTDACDWTSHPAALEADVTPDGRHLAFMSTESLPTVNFPSGYDNIDIKTGEPDSEVYEYGAPSAAEEAAGASGKLVCASCDPSGAPPDGYAFIAGVAPQRGAADVAFRSTSTPFHHVRALSENGGRVFFASPPTLSEEAFDASETPFEKVYEYEQDGEGSCASSNGCTYRISSASNSEEDLFLDAGASGDDVFFATRSRLASTDEDDLVDVYDARVEGGVSMPPSVSPCQSDCRPPSVTTSGVAPPMSGVIGPSGNLPAPSPTGSVPTKKPQRRVARCAKRGTRRHGKCVARKKKVRRGKRTTSTKVRRAGR